MLPARPPPPPAAPLPSRALVTALSPPCWTNSCCVCWPGRSAEWPPSCWGVTHPSYKVGGGTGQGARAGARRGRSRDGLGSLEGSTFLRLFSLRASWVCGGRRGRAEVPGEATAGPPSHLHSSWAASPDSGTRAPRGWGGADGLQSPHPLPPPSAQPRLHQGPPPAAAVQRGNCHQGPGPLWP